MADDLHERLYDEVESQMVTLSAGAPLRQDDRRAWTSQELETALVAVAADKQALLDHWRIRPGATHPAAPVNARECGQPQPCPHVLGLAQKYGLL